MKRALLALTLVLATESSAWATWSIIAVDKKTGQVIVASATCVAQAAFPKRQPNGARDLMDVQAVIVPGARVSACHAAPQKTPRKLMMGFQDIKKVSKASKNL